MSGKRSEHQQMAVDEIVYNASFKFDFRSLRQLCKHNISGVCCKTFEKDSCVVVVCPVVAAQLKAESAKTDTQQTKVTTCPHFDEWTFFDAKGNLKMKIPSCANKGKQ